MFVHKNSPVKIYSNLRHCAERQVTRDKIDNQIEGTCQGFSAPCCTLSGVMDRDHCSTLLLLLYHTLFELHAGGRCRTISSSWLFSTFSSFSAKEWPVECDLGKGNLSNILNSRERKMSSSTITTSSSETLTVLLCWFRSGGDRDRNVGNIRGEFGATYRTIHMR